MPSPSMRSTLFSKFEKLLPSQRKSPRSCKNSSTLSWWGSISGSLHAAKLLLATFLTYLKRRVFLNGAFDAFGRKSVNIKVIAIKQTRPTNTIRWLCSRILHGILILFMCILSYKLKAGCPTQFLKQNSLMSLMQTFQLHENEISILAGTNKRVDVKYYLVNNIRISNVLALWAGNYQRYPTVVFVKYLFGEAKLPRIFFNLTRAKNF